jgi:hypothetical protein
MKSNKSRIVAPVQRAKGGKAAVVVAGNPKVLKEAKEGKTGDKDVVGKKKGGKVVGLMTGGKVRPRLDRPGRKSGGGVGANSSPLSTAHNTTSQDAGSSNPQDTYGGTPK